MVAVVVVFLYIWIVFLIICLSVSIYVIVSEIVDRIVDRVKDKRDEMQIPKLEIKNCKECIAYTRCPSGQRNPITRICYSKEYLAQYAKVEVKSNGEEINL